MSKRTRYDLRLPNANQRRKSFQLYKNRRRVNDARVTAVNEMYLTGQLDFELAKLELRKVVEELRREEVIEKRGAYPDANLDVLARAIADYDERPVDKISDRSRRVAIAGLRRVVDLLGTSVLHSVSGDKLERLVNLQSAASRPKIVIYLNILLKHAGRRADILHIPGQPDPEVRYLTIDEFTKVLKEIPELLRAPVCIAFTTGCRLGEVFALERYGRTASVWVERQLYYKEVNGVGWYGPCKWGKKRWAPVMAIGQKPVQDWITQLQRMTEEEKCALRRIEWSEVVRTACKEVFPTARHKWLTFRDIRHCYAIYWLDRGATLRHVGQSMGNTERVVAKHYSGFVQTDEGETTMLALEKKEEGK